MKTLQVNNYKNFVRKAAIKYSTTCQQIQDIAEELECTVFCQDKKMYNNPYNYYLISQEDIYRICNELEARKDKLAQPKEAKKRSCKEDKLEWLINQGATVDVTDKTNVYIVSMYNGAIVKKFNLSCGMQNIQNYFDRCFSKHKDSDYKEREANKAKTNQKKVISIGSMDENGIETIEAELTADEFLEYAERVVAE